MKCQMQNIHYYSALSELKTHCSQEEYAPDANIIHRSSMDEAIRELGDKYSILTSARCEEITSQGVKITRQGKEELLPATLNRRMRTRMYGGVRGRLLN